MSKSTKDYGDPCKVQKKVLPVAEHLLLSAAVEVFISALMVMFCS